MTVVTVAGSALHVCEPYDGTVAVGAVTMPLVLTKNFYNVCHWTTLLVHDCIKLCGSFIGKFVRGVHPGTCMPHGGERSLLVIQLCKSVSGDSSHLKSSFLIRLPNRRKFIICDVTVVTS